jgi:hypothetical protein
MIADCASRKVASSAVSIAKLYSNHATRNTRLAAFAAHERACRRRARNEPADTPMAADAPTMAVDAPTMAVDAPTMAVDAPT